MTFAENVKAFRIEKGLTKKELSDKAGINYHTYIGYEAGKREPKYQVLCQMAEVLQVSTDQLLGYDLTDIEKAISFLRRLGFEINKKEYTPEAYELLGSTSDEYEFNPFYDNPSDKLSFTEKEILKFVKEVKLETSNLINYFYLINRFFIEYDRDHFNPGNWANRLYDNNVANNIAFHLKKIRETMHLTADAFAARFHISSDDYERLENPDPYSEPDHMIASEIASQLSMTLDELEAPCELPFADNLRDMRKKQFLSAKELAKSIGININTYMGYEHTGRQPPFSVLCKIAGVLGCSIDELLGNSTPAMDQAAEFLKEFGYGIRKTVHDQYEVVDMDDPETILYGPYTKRIFLGIVDHIQDHADRYVNQKEIAKELFFSIYTE